MDAMKDLRAFILIMAILAFVWLFTGGPLRPSSKSGWFLNKPPQKAVQETKKQTEEILGTKSSTPSKEAVQNSSSKQSSSSSQSSIKPDFVVLKATMARETDPNKEYVEIKADNKNKSPMKITGWKLKGKTGLDIAIVKGASYIYASIANQPQEDIYLKPGEKAVIVTGKSSLGTSFKMNKCVGYFEQFHEFTPELDTECPLLRDDEPPANLINNDQCLDYIDRVSSCQTVISIPYKYSIKLSSSCQEYVTQNANYKTCLEKHKDDSDFYLPEWRIYLERSEELWKKKRETITLYDDKNNIIDSKSY